MKKLVVMFYGDRYESPPMDSTKALVQLGTLQQVAEDKQPWAHFEWGSFSGEKLQAFYMEDAE